MNRGTISLIIGVLVVRGSAKCQGRVAEGPKGGKREGRRWRNNRYPGGSHFGHSAAQVAGYLLSSFGALTRWASAET